MPHRKLVTVLPLNSGVGPLIFNVGNDASLLSYRGDVLKLAGFRVTAIHLRPWKSGEFELLCRTNRPAIFIACHTLNREQRLALATYCRAESPETKLIALSAGDLTQEETALYDDLFDSLDGPIALIERLRAQL